MSDKTKAIVMNDEDIIKRKLLIDGDGVGDDRRINIAMRQFIKWCVNEDETEEESQLSYEKLLLTLRQCELAMVKSDRMFNMHIKEMKNYENLYNKIETQIAEVRQKIEKSKIELVNAKRIRKNKCEYDALASIINKHADRKESMERLCKLESEINELQNLKQEMERKIEKRRKQFQVLIGAAHQLQIMLNEEENEQTDGQTSTNEAGEEEVMEVD